MRQTNQICWLLACVIGFISGSANAAGDIPRLEKRDGMTKLIVDGRPFICVAGELANSSSTDVETMKSAWPRLAQMNLNTILSVVSWDLIEPEEGKFDFWMVDYQLEAARANHLRLIFLWMASWKNGMSHYPPRWVKANQDRFPRVKDADGHTLEVLSTFSQANRDADARAFAALMKHLRQVDSKDHTVIAIQVENEVGLLSSSRDHNPAANEAFAKPVPAELMDYLQKHKDNLLPELQALWVSNGSENFGTWEEVFGKNIPSPWAPRHDEARTRPLRPAGAELYSHTDEIFMAWNYARYIGYVAAQGKQEYPLPMYCNAWLVNPTDQGPGDYPSGGPEPLVHDIWRAGAPAIDILAPDIYLPEFAQIMQTFARNGNPAFNPETRQDANNCWTAFTQLNALCFSHMGIDNFNGWNPESDFAHVVSFVGQLSGAIAEAQGKKDAIKLIPLAQGQNPGKVEMGDYMFDFTPVPGSRGGGRGAAAARPAAEAGTNFFLNNPFVLIINTAPDEYYFATDGNFPFRVSTKTPGANIVTAATIDRGYFNDGKWVLAHRLNGDDILTAEDLSGAAANHQSGTVVPLGSRGRWNVPFASAGGLSPAPTFWHVTFYQYH
ncbi:MAG: DUF5597 domain-containing protein [Verrucomicrobiota bacterium]